MKNFFIKTFFLVAAVVSFIVLAESAKATSYLPQSGEDFIVEFTPEKPGANTQVTGQAISYTFDIDRANIVWFINGKKAGAGKTFSFTTPGLGLKTSLDVAVVTYEGQKLDKSFSFQSAEVDLLWETLNYVPLQYKGKALPTNLSDIKITAFPYGMKSTDSKLIYQWTLNDEKKIDQSGAAKNVFTFRLPRNGQGAVEVQVSSPDNSIIATNKLQINAGQPKILFYEENPLAGPLYQKELGNAFSINKPEFTIRAEPYFLSKRNLGSDSYEWAINGNPVATPRKPTLLNLAIPANATGISTIKLSIQNQKNIFEFAEKFLQANLNI